MATHQHPRTGQTITARGVVAKVVERRGYLPISAPTPSDELKGKALDDALDAAGLSKTGSADEKRARLAEHEAPDPQDPAHRPPCVDGDVCGEPAHCPPLDTPNPDQDQQ